MITKVYSALLISASSFLFAQVSIGKTNTVSSSISLDFGNIAGDAATQKGILLPRVTSAAAVSGVVPGTLIFDNSDKKVKYFKEIDDDPPFWFDLSVDGTGTSDNLQNNLVEQLTAKTSVGTPTAVPGILVLEDNNKAMVLPSVDKYSSIVNPSAGMMVYDIANNMFCLFNGTVWSFWKP